MCSEGAASSDESEGHEQIESNREEVPTIEDIEVEPSSNSPANELEEATYEQNLNWRNQNISSISRPGTTPDDAFADLNDQLRIQCRNVSNLRPLSSASSSSASTAIVLNLNEIVACVPTSEARKADEEVGYSLPFSLGRIVEVKTSSVVVNWMFSRHIDGRWYPWDESIGNLKGSKKTRKLRRDELDFECILRDEMGVLRIKFCADKTLTKVSISRLKAHSELKMAEDSWRAHFRKPL